MAKGRAVAIVLAQRRYALEPQDHGQEDAHAPSTMHRIRRAFGLQPHRVETFKLSSDPFFVEKGARYRRPLLVYKAEASIGYESCCNVRIRRANGQRYELAMMFPRSAADLARVF
jgi:hypothetical protein